MAGASPDQSCLSGHCKGKPGAAALSKRPVLTPPNHAGDSSAFLKPVVWSRVVKLFASNWQTRRPKQPNTGLRRIARRYAKLSCCVRSDLCYDGHICE